MSTEQIRNSLEGVIQYLREHPEDARSTDKAATAVIEEGLNGAFTRGLVCLMANLNQELCQRTAPISINCGLPPTRWEESTQGHVLPSFCS